MNCFFGIDKIDPNPDFSHSLLLSDHPAPEPTVPGPKKLDLTRENLNALLGLGGLKQKSQNPSTHSSPFTRDSGQTSGGRGPGTTLGVGGWEREREGWVFLHTGSGQK